MYKLVHFFTYNKLYLITGVVLLGLFLLPTKEKISSSTRKLFYFAAVIWVICFAYRVNTGQDITYLFKKNNAAHDTFNPEAQPGKVTGPFNKYYSNDAGRKPKNGE